MYSYSQLLLRNTLLGLLFNTLMAVMLLSFFSKGLSTTQIQMQPSLSATIDFLQENNQHDKLAIFLNLADFNSLTLSNTTKTLYKYEASTANIIGRFISSPASSFTTKKGLTVSFTVSSTHAEDLISKIIIIR